MTPNRAREAVTGICLSVNRVMALGRPEYCMPIVQQSPPVRYSKADALHSLALPRPVVVTMHRALRLHASVRSISASTASATPCRLREPIAA